MPQKNTEELIIEAKGFFSTYKHEIGESIRRGKKVVFINFDDLSSHSPILAEALISSPEEILQNLETALEETGLIKNPRIRLNNLPETQRVKIRTIRAEHLNQLIYFEGLVRQASDVRPQVVNAKFECPSCGAVISVLQIDRKFREPSRCSCGRKGQFRLISKAMVDAQRLVIEEAPESLTGGEQPRRISVFLKEDLVEPVMEEKTTPGSKVRVLGILKEVPIPLQTGAISTRFDLAVEANNLIPLESSYEDLEINDEEEKQIQELSADPELFKRLRNSIAPSIWGYEEIKEALVLQMFSGVRKVNPTDGSVSRGDIHLFLMGDPGVAKSLSREDKIMYISENETGYENLDKIYDKFKRFPRNLKVLTIDMQNHEPRWENVSEIIKHLPEKELIKITTEHGKNVTGTKDHSFITLSEKGEIISIKGNELTKNSYVPIPINYHKELFKIFNPGYFNKKNTNSKILPDKINLDKDFGFFVGIFLAEGYIQNEETINISNTNEEIQKRVINFSKKLGLNYTQNKKGVSLFSSNLSRILISYCYNSKELKSINKGIKGNYSRIKKIPGFMHFAPKEFIYGLLSGLFSGDGRLIQDKKMLKGFELVTISKNLAENTSDMLFSVGILNKLKPRKYNYKGKITDCYYVSIPTYTINQFLENIEIIGRKIKLNKNSPIYSYNNLIPCGNLVYKVVKKLGYNSRISGNRTLAAEMRTVKKRNELGKLRLLRLIKEFESRTKEKNPDLEILKKIANSNIVWSKIKEIEVLEKKNEEVYDLSIPSTNTFVANGIGVHNSQVLKFISNIAPRGRYVVGMGASGRGLTASVIRDDFLKGWSLEAGAMVLANKGIVCLHPESNIIANNQILPIEEIFNKKKSKIFFSNNQAIEVSDLSLETPSLVEKLEFKPVKSTMVRRKFYNGKMLRIDLNSGFSLALTPEHKLVNGDTLEWEEANNFKKGDYLLAPLKLPENNSEMLIFDIIPDNWLILLNDTQKKELKQIILKKYKSLSEFNKKFNLSRHYLSGGKQLKIKIFKEILADLGITEFWKDKLLKFGREKNGESLKINKITPGLAYLIGFIYGDGNINVSKKHSRIQITQSIKNIKQIEKIKEMLNLVSNRPFKEYQRTSHSVIREKEVISEHKVLYADSNLLAFLVNFFLKKELSNILRLNNNCVKAFIAGCMDSDGCISIKKCKKNNEIYKIPCVEFLLSNNERANKNFMLTLRRLDCYSRFINKKPISIIRLTGRQDICKLLEDIAKFSIKIKDIPLRKKQISSASSKLPIEIVSKICKRVVEECDNTQELNSSGISSTIYGYINKKIQPSREQLEKIKNKLNISEKTKQEIEVLLKRDFFIDKILNISEEDYSGYVYDLYVPETHNFISEGLVVHNCIDEIEKMGAEDRSAMHEALEQQSVTISKANIQASLTAQTSVLAAGNPKYGRFEPLQPIAQQIDLPPALINRFDLIFILRDLPNKKQDDAIATHVLKLHQLKGEKSDIDRELFRKYVAYAKQKTEPKLTDEAVEEIKNFYVKLRNMQSSGDQRGIPISARQLQALVRLAEAHAKTRLSNKVKKEDSQVAIRLMNYYLMQVGYDPETKTFDIDRFTTHISSSQRGKIILVKETIRSLEEKHGKMVPLDILRSELGNNINDTEFEEAIQKLKSSGDIFQPKGGFVQLI